jgi:hypothetical protein
MGFADASVGGGVGWFAGSDRAEAGDSALRAAVKQRVRRIADKTSTSVMTGSTTTAPSRRRTGRA